MRTAPLLLCAALLCAACGGPAARAKRPAPGGNDAPREYTYRIVATHPHSTAAYTQGLLWHDGLLWEGTGQYGASVVQTLDPATGRTRQLAQLPASEFGEGIAVLDGRLYQLTWQSNTAHVYTIRPDGTLEPLRDHRYAGEGWGLTTDGRKLYMTDGSAHLYTVDPETFRREGSVTVTYRGTPVRYLNELEWIDGRIWANVYTTDRIVVIDPATGTVEAVVDLGGLLPDSEVTPETDVLNGIAWDAASGRLFVTGKNWSRLYEIEPIER